MEVTKEFIKNKDGKATYQSWLNSFFESIGYQEKIRKGVYKTIKEPNNYFDDNRNYDQDMIIFANFIKNSVYHASSVNCYSIWDFNYWNPNPYVIFSIFGIYLIIGFKWIPLIDRSLPIMLQFDWHAASGPNPIVP